MSDFKMGSRPPPGVPTLWLLKTQESTKTKVKLLAGTQGMKERISKMDMIWDSATLESQKLMEASCVGEPRLAERASGMKRSSMSCKVLEDGRSR